MGSAHIEFKPIRCKNIAATKLWAALLLISALTTFPFTLTGISKSQLPVPSWLTVPIVPYMDKQRGYSNPGRGYRPQFSFPDADYLINFRLARMVVVLTAPFVLGVPVTDWYPARPTVLQALASHYWQTHHVTCFEKAWTGIRPPYGPSCHSNDNYMEMAFMFASY